MIQGLVETRQSEPQAHIGRPSRLDKVEAKKLFIVVQVTSASMVSTWASYPCRKQADRMNLILTPCLTG